MERLAQHARVEEAIYAKKKKGESAYETWKI
jgi:hypothetical protein